LVRRCNAAAARVALEAAPMVVRLMFELPLIMIVAAVATLVIDIIAGLIGLLR
jgi:hypothetical protein